MGERRLLRFSQQGALKYAGHLDVMRIFQRTLRRAGLPIAYSQGFNPHPLLSFALPLPLGMESENDYAEIVLTEPLPDDAVLERLNAHAPAGLRFTGVTAQREGVPSAASRVTAADYRLTLPGSLSAEASESIGDVLRGLLEETAIIIPKKTKSGVRDTDVRPDIHALRLEADGSLFMRLAAGSARSLNPRAAAGLILGRAGIDADAAVLPVKRLALWPVGDEEA